MIKKMILVVILYCFLAGCTTSLPLTPSVSPTHTPSITPQTDETEPSADGEVTLVPTAMPALSGAYLGQDPPGMEPKIFAPGIVSSDDSSEFSGTFSADGSEYYFYRFSDDMESMLLFSRIVDGIWTAPEQVAITAGYGAGEPHVTLDDQWLYFMWDHPVPEGKPKFPAYFVSQRTVNGWSEPKYAGQGMYVSSTREGELFTTDMSTRNRTGKTYLVQVAVEEGVFASMARLEIQARMGSQAHPCIAPDGSYILFDVDSGSHLFISFRQPDGTWGEAIDLVDHGFDALAGGAYVSPDGKYLFFALNRDIWWVDIAVIEGLRSAE